VVGSGMTGVDLPLISDYLAQHDGKGIDVLKNAKSLQKLTLPHWVVFLNGKRWVKAGGWSLLFNLLWARSGAPIPLVAAGEARAASGPWNHSHVPLSIFTTVSRVSFVSLR